MLSIERLKEKAATLKTDIPALMIALKHPVMPPWPKIIIILAVGYALSPIDLIPDFIPVLGYLDDLILLPLLTAWAIKLIPNEIMEECRVRAEGASLKTRKRWIGSIVILLLWLLLAWAVIHGINKRMTIGG